MDRHQIDPYPLRIPDNLRRRIQASADDNDRSLHREILRRLEESFGGNDSAPSPTTGAAPALQAQVPARPAWLSLKQLSTELKMDRSACRRWMLAQGVEPTRKRMADSGYQVALAITRDVADKLVAIRKEEGYL